MSELTKEYFEQALKAAIAPLAMQAELRATEERTAERIDEAQESLARMVSAGFEDIKERLDVRDQVQRHERALHDISEKLGLRFEL